MDNSNNINHYFFHDANYENASEKLEKSTDQEKSKEKNTTNLNHNSGDQYVSFDIVGTEGDDVLFAKDSGSKIKGKGGNDQLVGGAGNDVLRGNAGNDIFWTGRGNNKVRTGSGNDQVYAERGNDRIFAKGGNNTILDHGGDNFIQARNIGGGLTGSTNIWALGGGNNEIVFDRGYVQTEGGDDQIEIGVGQKDTENLIFSGAGNNIHNNLGAANNSIISGDGNDSFYDTYPETFGLFGTAASPNPQRTSGNQNIWAGAGDNFAELGSGTNYFQSEGGRDSVTTAAGGTNTIFSGAGEDQIISRANDQIVSGEGDDRIAINNSGTSSVTTNVWAGEGDDSISLSQPVGKFYVDGGAGGSDTLDLSDLPSSVKNNLNLEEFIAGHTNVLKTPDGKFEVQIDNIESIILGSDYSLKKTETGWIKVQIT